MGLRTPLYDMHVAAGARIVDFGGWDMPVNYGSQIEEHHAVRRDAGMFDVSHMCVVDLRGDRVRDFLRRLLANDVAKLTEPGKALYSCMLRDDGGVIDDLIVYYLNDQWYRMVVNAGTRDKDIAWLSEHAATYEVAVEPRPDLAMIAVQGPNARQKAAKAMDPALAARALELGVFFGLDLGSLFVARTGYTGEDGWEIMLPAARGSRPLGAAARGGCWTLRPRRARHAAPRSGHESLWQRHGRDHVAAGIGARLDDCLGTAGSRFHRPWRAWLPRRPAAPRANSSACWSRSAQCCVRTRKSSLPAWARAR